MKKTFLLKTMLLLCALIVGSSSVWAGDVLISTCLFGGSHGYSSDYTSTWTASNGSFSWSVSNGNTNGGPSAQNPWNYVKFGRKSNASVGTVITSATYSEAIFKVVVTIDALTASKINSIKLYTSSNKSTWTEAGSFTKAIGEQSVTLASPTANLYYKVEFDCASGSSNGLIQVSKIEYFKTDANVVTVSKPTFSPSAGAVAYGTKVSVSADEGCILYYTTDGTDPAESSTAIWTETNTATVNITGATTIRAIAIDEELNKSIEASAQYTIAAPNKPNFSPNAGAVALGTKVSLSASVDMILYTIDGTTPSFSNNTGEIYTEPIEIKKGTMIKAIAVDDGGNESSVATAIFTINYPDASSDAFDFEQITDDYDSSVAVTTDGQSYVEEEKTWTSGNVTLKTNGKYRWWKDGNGNGTLRVYNNDPQSTLTLSVPSGYVITKIVFTGGQQFTSNVGTYYSGTWFGDEQSVTFTYNSTSSVNVKTITITYNCPVEITPAKAVTTYVTSCNLDFEGIAGLDAFVATAAANGVVTLAEVGAVPAGTPLLLRGTASTPYTVPVVGSATAPTTNLLKAGDGVTPVGGSNAYDYVLSDGKWYRIGPDPSAVSVSKAYLHCDEDPLAGGAPELSMDWGEGTTAIQSIERTINDNQYYTLDGRCVAEPTKGLYIINGKKVVIK